MSVNQKVTKALSTKKLNFWQHNFSAVYQKLTLSNSS